MTVDIVAIAIRALSFIALIQATGMAMCIVMFGRLLGESQVSLRRICSSSAWIAIAMVLFYQWLSGARLVGEFSGLVDAAMQMLALKSTVGLASSECIVGLLLIAGSLPRRSAAWRVVAMVGIAVVTISFSVTGHAVHHPQHGLLVTLLLVHLWIVAFWLGGLVLLFVSSVNDAPASAARLITKFSLIATWLVPVIAIAGAWMALTLLPNRAALLEPYGLLLLCKVTGFALLMGFAAWNKWRLAPAIARGDARSVQLFRRSVAVEYALICVVLSITAVMTGLFSPES